MDDSHREKMRRSLCLEVRAQEVTDSLVRCCHSDPSSGCVPRTHLFNGQSQARFSARVARFCAVLAVQRLVRCALVATGLTDVRAESADRSRIFTAPGHCGRGELAHRRTIHVECDATDHHPYLSVLQARGRTVAARNGAVVASLDAVGVPFMWRSQL